MFPPVYQLLKANADVRAFVGPGSPRIFKHGHAPQDIDKALAYITWSLIVGTPENNLSDVPDIDRNTTQIDVWHPDSPGATAMAQAVRDCLEPVAHMTSVVLDTWEAEVKRYRIGLQFDFLLNR